MSRFSDRCSRFIAREFWRFGRAWVDFGGTPAAVSSGLPRDDPVREPAVLIEELYGIPATCPIDFENVAIPFEGQFDLIVSNHMMTHAVRPSEFLVTVRSRLTPEGHLYVYAEPVEAEFIEQGKSMFNTLNAFHLQTFNTPSAVRALEANGFTILFCTVREGHFLGLAQATDAMPTDWRRMEDRERARRRQAYRVANDLAILRVPHQVRDRVAAEWDAALQRSLANGTAEITKKGTVKVHPPENGIARRSRPS